MNWSLARADVEANRTLWCRDWSVVSREFMKSRAGRTWVFAILLLSTCTMGKGQSSATEAIPRAAGSGLTAQSDTNRALGDDETITNQSDNGKLILAGDVKPARAQPPNAPSTKVGFWFLQGLMFGSAVAAAETTHNCIQAGSCTAIPPQFRTRTAMYNAGLPVAAGVAILSYEMKKHGNHWWFVPSTL